MKPLHLLLALLVVSSSGVAHSPRMVPEGVSLSLEAAYAIPDIETSWALFAKLPAGRVEWYRFEASANQQVWVSMTVPDIRGLERFAPSFAVIGAGLPASGLPWVPRGLGAVVAPPGPARLETHGGHGYWVRQGLELRLPRAGRYFIAVFHPEGQGGKYVLAPGRRERFVNDGAASSQQINAYFEKP